MVWYRSQQRRKRNGMEPFLTKNTKNGTEQDGLFSTKNPKNGTECGWNDWKKNERGRNYLAEGTHSRTEQNDFKKVRTASDANTDLHLIIYPWV